MTSFLAVLGLNKKSVTHSSVLIRQVRAGASLFQCYWNTMEAGWANRLTNLVVSHKMEAMDLLEVLEFFIGQV